MALVWSEVLLSFSTNQGFGVFFDFFGLWYWFRFRA